MGGQSAAKPVFSKCPRCEYSLCGLPANHACPECGLRYDEECELYRVTNPKQVLFVWVAILGSGWVVLQNLPDSLNFSAASTWNKVGAVAAVLWIVFVAAGVLFLIKRYRRGYEVAVTANGLILRLPGFSDDVIPWSQVGGASVKQKPSGKRQVALVQLRY